MLHIKLPVIIFILYVSLLFLYQNKDTQKQKILSEIIQTLS